MPASPILPTIAHVARRLIFAIGVYLLLMWIILLVHDYPQFRAQLQKIQQHDPIAEARPWIGFFYFLNEAGSGIKFILTGNEKYMAHFPSPSHLLASRTALAATGDWEMQLLVGRMYYFGEFAPVDKDMGLQWLEAAHQTAPPEQRAAIAAIIEKIKQRATENPASRH